MHVCLCGVRARWPVCLRSGRNDALRTHFGGTGDGNADEMPMKRTALTLLALLGSAVLGDGKFFLLLFLGRLFDASEHLLRLLSRTCFVGSGHRLLSLIVMALRIRDLANPYLS